MIGDPNKGHVSNYYLGQVTTEKEVAAIQKAAESLKVDVLNTRVQKDGDGDFILLVASAEEQEETLHELQVEGYKSVGSLKVKYGDFKEALQKSVDALEKAKEEAANPHQQSAIEEYIKSSVPKV